MEDCEKYFRYEHFQCSCHQPDHQVRVTLSYVGDEPELSIESIMNFHLPFWKRAVAAFRYVFEIKATDDHWSSWHFDSTLLSPEDVERLGDIIDEYHARKAEYKALRNR